MARVDPASVTQQDLIRWAEALSGVARTGLGFTESLYERERYEEIVHIAAEMRSAAGHSIDRATLASEWMKGVGQGASGYVTPKVAIGAVVGNDNGEILLIQRSDSGHWLYPTGWADIGYSPAEVAVKEVHEETGIEAEVIGLIAVLDGMRRGFTRTPLYSLVFHLRAIGGTLAAHPLECRDVGFFSFDAMPDPLAGGANLWGLAASAIRGDALAPYYDEPRGSVWRVGE